MAGVKPSADHPRPAGRRTGGLWPIILLLALIAVCLIGYWVIQLPAPNRNRLAIGPAAHVAALEIAIQPPAELDFKSKAEVLAWREEAVRRYPDLLAGDYKPAESIFGQIEDGLPWWGLAGYFYYGPGGKSIEGLSEESRFLLNPYLLVGVDLYHNWQSLPEREITRSGFALDCPPTQLRWQPSAARAEAVYEARCVARTNSRLFDLIAYNARDMNLNYIYVSYADSHSISKPNPPSAPYAIPQYIHRGGSCGYPGGCNNMSPPTPEIDALEITGFPAEAVIRLWTRKPASVEQTPDMVFVIQFR
jgi:hypothetical protein